MKWYQGSIQRIFGLVLLMGLFQSSLIGADYVILETLENGRTNVVEGNEALVTKKFSSASTIKMVLAWAGLETAIIGSQTAIFCKDRFIKGCPKVLNLHEALVLSSNTYFEEIAQKLGETRVTEMVRKSGFFQGGPASSWLSGGVRSAAHGGAAKISPREQHEFMLRLMRGELGSNEKINVDLNNALQWPTPDDSVKLFGKTGSDGKVLWFNGYGEKGGQRKAVTVFFKGPVNVRKKVIALFYNRWGLAWNEALLDKPGFFLK